MLNRFDKINDENFIMVFNESESKNEIIRKLNLPENGTSIRYVNKMIKKLGLSIETLKENHFNKYHIKKTCPVCGKEFYVPNYESNKICCSYACSNTYFRSGENNGMYKKEIHTSSDEKIKEYGRKSRERTKKANEKNRQHYVSQKGYKKICFKYHPHKCCVCGEENVVAVHHYDGNHFNNEPSNLLPLCPTHHVYIHSKYKNLIIDKINSYIEEFKKNFEE